MFKIFTAFCVVAAGAAIAMPVDAQQKGPVSPHDKVGAVIAGARVTIYYGRPYTKDPKSGDIRKVFGNPKVVEFDKPWRAGADEATTLTTTGTLKIGDAEVPPGAYTLYVVPSEKGATKLAVSTVIGGWGIPVNTTKDLARVDMKTEKLDKTVDQFTIAIASKKGEPTADLKMMWENTQFSVPFTVVKK